MFTQAWQWDLRYFPNMYTRDLIMQHEKFHIYTLKLNTNFSIAKNPKSDHFKVKVCIEVFANRLRWSNVICFCWSEFHPKYFLNVANQLFPNKSHSNYAINQKFDPERSIITTMICIEYLKYWTTNQKLMAAREILINRIDVR